MNTDLDLYTTTPTHVQVFAEVFRGDDGRVVAVEWYVHGMDDSGHYTEACWSYDSFGEAISALPTFVETQKWHAGVRFAWRGGA